VVVLLGNIDWNTEMAIEYSRFNFQAGTLGAAAMAALGLGGWAIDRAVNHQGTGGTIAAGAAALALALPTGYGIYQQYKMGDDTISTNKHSETGFGLLGKK
jgi:hypothetical protein